MRPAPKIRSALAFLFPGVVAGVHIDNLFLKQALDGLLDLNLVGARADAKNVLVQFFAEQRRLFRQRRGLDDIVGLVHLLSRRSLG